VNGGAGSWNPTGPGGNAKGVFPPIPEDKVGTIEVDEGGLEATLPEFHPRLAVHSFQFIDPGGGLPGPQGERAVAIDWNSPLIFTSKLKVSPSSTTHMFGLSGWKAM
jgi:hypothetical protein